MWQHLFVSRHPVIILRHAKLYLKIDDRRQHFGHLETMTIGMRLPVWSMSSSGRLHTCPTDEGPAPRSAPGARATCSCSLCSLSHRGMRRRATVRYQPHPRHSPCRPSRPHWLRRFYAPGNAICGCGSAGPRRTCPVAGSYHGVQGVDNEMDEIALLPAGPFQKSLLMTRPGKARATAYGHAFVVSKIDGP